MCLTPIPQPVLKARNRAEWTIIDSKIDTVLREFRAVNPNSTTKKEALLVLSSAPVIYTVFMKPEYIAHAVSIVLLLAGVSFALAKLFVFPFYQIFVLVLILLFVVFGIFGTYMSWQQKRRRDD